MSDCYDNAPAIYDRKLVTARKTHTCCECLNDISSGESYYLDKGLWGGKWDSHKTCQRCDLLIRAFSQDGECPCIGELHEHVYWSDGSHERVTFLADRNANIEKRKAAREQAATS